MRFIKSLPTVAAIAAAAVVAASALPPGLARAQQQTYVMKISTPTIHDIPDQWAANFAAAVERAAVDYRIPSSIRLGKGRATSLPRWRRRPKPLRRPSPS